MIDEQLKRSMLTYFSIIFLIVTLFEEMFEREVLGGFPVPVLPVTVSLQFF